LSGEACADGEGNREVGLAGAGSPEEDHVLAGVQEVELAKVLDAHPPALFDADWHGRGIVRL